MTCLSVGLSLLLFALLTRSADLVRRVAAEWLTLRANLADPVRLDGPLFLGALGSFLAYTLYWTWSLMRAFRLPSSGSA